ncbi:MAG TPA: ABC transporter ATP-binding protein [Elusimicrobia bacterium]|nr:ABC transporter ATP-binding protein [Elusimicrobiota bacterium]
MNAIEIKNLTKIYIKKRLLKNKKFLAVDNLSFDVAEGEIFGFLGPNGSGKTTTIKTLLGLLFPTSGECFIFAEKVPSLSALSKIGYLPEIPYLYKYLTAKEILSLYGSVSGISENVLKNRIDEVLETVKLKTEKDTRLGEFSKGMLQRVGVAQALIHKPQLLILDEPFTGLDPLGLKDMRDIILSLKKDGKTVFFSSHIISEAEKICSRVAIIYKGKLLRIVKIKEIKPNTLEDIFISEIEQAERV